MLSNGFVLLNRSITDWRWYQDANTFRLWVHLIVNANFVDKDFEGITIRRGQLVTSYASLSRDLGISLQSVRTALGHLKSTGEITTSVHPKYQVITIVNYDQYQTNQQGNQQATNRQSTGNQQATNNNLTKQIILTKQEDVYSAPPAPAPADAGGRADGGSDAPDQSQDDDDDEEGWHVITAEEVEAVRNGTLYI